MKEQGCNLTLNQIWARRLSNEATQERTIVHCLHHNRQKRRNSGTPHMNPNTKRKFPLHKGADFRGVNRLLKLFHSGRVFLQIQLNCTLEKWIILLYVGLS